MSCDLLENIRSCMVRAAVWIGYYWLLPDIIGYFLYSFKTHGLLRGKNVWKQWHVLWRYKNLDTVVTKHFLLSQYVGRSKDSTGVYISYPPCG